MRITSLLIALFLGLGLNAQFFNVNTDANVLTSTDGTIRNVDTIPFVHTFTSGELANDSIQINAFKFPFVGSKRSIGSWEYFIGQIDFSPAGGRLVGRMQAVRNSDFKSYYVDVDSLFGVTITSEIGGSRIATIEVPDTNVLISVYDTVVTEFNRYGLRVPRLDAEPTVSSANATGLIYYNTTDSLFFGHEGDQWKPLIGKWAGVELYTYRDSVLTVNASTTPTTLTGMQNGRIGPDFTNTDSTITYTGTSGDWAEIHFNASFECNTNSTIVYIEVFVNDTLFEKCSISRSISSTGSNSVGNAGNNAQIQLNNGDEIKIKVSVDSGTPIISIDNMNFQVHK